MPLGSQSLELNSHCSMLIDDPLVIMLSSYMYDLARWLMGISVRRFFVWLLAYLSRPH